MVSYQGADGESQGHIMYLFIILTLECEKGTLKAELMKGNNIVNGQGSPTA